MVRIAWASSTMLLAAAASACASPADQAGASLPPVQIGQPFVLQPGQSVAVAGAADGLQVGFDRVLADSRCPKGERCIWAGDAIALVWLAPPAGPRMAAELHTAPGQAQALTMAGRTVQLLRLDPAPVSGRPRAPDSYRATLVLQATAASADGQQQ